MAMHYSIFDTQSREKVDLSKQTYLYADDIPNLLYFIQNNMQLRPKHCSMTWDTSDEYESLEVGEFSEILSDTKQDANFTFISSKDLDEEFEIITLVRNNKKLRDRTPNWQSRIREII